jgi:hypothetical protein
MERSRCKNLLLGTDMRTLSGIPLVVVIHEPRITYASQDSTFGKTIHCTHGRVAHPKFLKS